MRVSNVLVIELFDFVNDRRDIVIFTNEGDNDRVEFMGSVSTWLMSSHNILSEVDGGTMLLRSYEIAVPEWVLLDAVADYIMNIYPTPDQMWEGERVVKRTEVRLEKYT